MRRPKLIAIGLAMVWGLCLPGVADASAGGWQIRTAADGTSQLVGEIDLEELKLNLRTQWGYDIAEADDCGYVSKPGHPLLPLLQIRVAVPEGMDATGVDVLSMRTANLEGTYNLMPAQPAVPCSQVGPHQWISEDAAVYDLGEPWPAQPARLLGQPDLAGQAMAVVEIYPLGYIPAEGTLRKHETIELAVSLEPGGARGDALGAHTTAAEIAEIEQNLRAQVVNPDQVRTSTWASTTLLPGIVPSRGVDPGNYDFVIICPYSFQTVFQELADWKIRRGLRTAIVTTNWIYGDGGYSGTDVEKIRAFIMDAHATWGATSFLLGGDTNEVPCHWRMIDDNIPNDSYYSDYDNDWVTEVDVGRVPARYSSYAYNFVQKVLGYEKVPPMTDFGKLAIFLGFDLDGSTPAEEVKIFIDDTYMPGDWTVEVEYDSEPGLHKEDAIAYINAGFNLLNHIDHSNTGQMGVGSTNHDEYLGVGNASNFSNGGRVGTVYTTGCWANDFDAYQCIGEAWVQNTGGGAAAFIGNSRYGWYNPGNMNTLSNRYDRYFFRSIFDQGNTRLGAAFSDHKNDQYPYDSTYQYIWTELTLLGDPEMPLWMDDPGTISVTHDASMVVGCDDCVVHVEYEGGGNVSGATVCLWKADEDLHLVATTNASGDASFSPLPTTVGSMFVTVSGQNVVPYEGDIEVTSSQGIEDDPARPRVLSLSAARTITSGGAELSFELPTESAVELAVYDLTGRQVRTLIGGVLMAPGRYPVTWDGRDEGGRPLSSGVYLYRLKAGGDSRISRTISLN